MYTSNFDIYYIYNRNTIKKHICHVQSPVKEKNDAMGT